MVKKAVIPAAGLGTRLLPTTKELPKEMLPVFIRNSKGNLLLKPMMHQIFEKLYDSGFREFCFIVGRGKRAIEDYFTPDYDFVSYLKSKKKIMAYELENFYKKIEDSTLIFINQPKPNGFGDAILKTKPFIVDDSFLVHAGDDLILSNKKFYLKRLINTFEKLKGDAVFLVEKVNDPQKYGVIHGEKIDDKLYKVDKIIEKPKLPPYNLAVIAIYIFNSKIFGALENTEFDEEGELQLTDAIQGLINEDSAVYALELEREEKRVEIGTPNAYWEALKSTFYLKTNG